TDGFGSQPPRAGRVKTRLRTPARSERIAPAHVDTPFEFSFPEPQKLPRPLLSLENQAAGHEGRNVLSGVNLVLSPGDRAAVLGRNGAGKSTLMRLLAGQATGTVGRRVEAPGLRVE